MAASSSVVALPFEGNSEELPTKLELDTHPLLIDHVLDEIFQYFEGDKTNLTSFRLVCKEWSVSAARAVKKSLCWRIGVRANTLGTDADAEKDEADFKSMVEGLDTLGINRPSSLFRNVHVKVFHNFVGQTYLHFLEKHGHLILDMKLACGPSLNWDSEATTARLALPHAPNLESLYLTDVTRRAIYMVDQDLVLPKVTKLRAETEHGLMALDEPCIVQLANLFPHLEELECEVSDNGTLHALYKAWPKLKRLNLGWSRISDIGITGLEQAELDTVTAENWVFNAQFTQKVENQLGVSLMAKPNIGLLTDLKHLTVELGNLSQHSVHLGLVHLKNLEYLKMKAYEHFSSWLSDGSLIPVPATALADCCPKLAKLDVVGHRTKSEETDLLDTSRLNWLESTGFCGLPADVVAYVKNKLPKLQFVYDRPSPAELADLGKRNALRMAELHIQSLKVEARRSSYQRRTHRDFPYDDYDDDFGGGRDYEDFSDETD